MILQQELSRQARIIEKAERFEREKNSIIADNEDMHNQLNEIKSTYSKKERDLEWEYKNKIKGLEKENSKLNRIIDTFYNNMHKFIDWICKKFSVAEDYDLVRSFEKENHILLDPQEQIKKEDRQKEWDLEL